jgi:hypothetical protein
MIILFHVEFKFLTLYPDLIVLGCKRGAKIMGLNCSPVKCDDISIQQPQLLF